MMWALGMMARQAGAGVLPAQGQSCRAWGARRQVTATCFSQEAVLSARPTERSQVWDPDAKLNLRVRVRGWISGVRGQAWSWLPCSSGSDQGWEPELESSSWVWWDFPSSLPSHTAAQLKLASSPGSQTPMRENGWMRSRHRQLRHFLLQRFSMLSMQIEVFSCKSIEPFEIVTWIKITSSLSFSDFPFLVTLFFSIYFDRLVLWNVSNNYVYTEFLTRKCPEDKQLRQWKEFLHIICES